MSKKRGSISEDIKNGTLPQGYELTRADVGRILDPVDGFGLVYKFDVGKRCYHRGGVFQMENNAQRDARKKDND